MIDLRESELCKSLEVEDPEQFYNLFGFHPFIELVSTDDIAEILNRCNFFMMDHQYCLHIFWPLRWRFQSLYKNIKPKLNNRAVILDLQSYLALAYFGLFSEILDVGDPTMIRWANKTRHLLKNHNGCYQHIITYRDCPLSLLDLVHLLTKKKADDPAVLREAIRFGDINVILWVLDHGGRLERIHWLDAMGGDVTLKISLWNFLDQMGCPIHSLTVASAASLGKIDFLRWWHSRGYPFCESTAAWAAVWGHVDIIQFVVDERLPLNREWTLRNASTCRAKNYYLRIKRIIEKGPTKN